MIILYYFCKVFKQINDFFHKETILKMKVKKVDLRFNLLQIHLWQHFHIVRNTFLNRIAEIQV